MSIPRRCIHALALPAILALAACADDPVAPDPGLDAPLAASDRDEDEVNVMNLPLLEQGIRVVIGESELERRKRRIDVEVEAEHELLGEGKAVTLWAIYFNAPAGCLTSPCGIGDFENDRGMPGITRAGAKVGDDEELEIEGRVRVGAPSIFPGVRPLMTAMAEVHFILQSHGDYDPNLPGQLEFPGAGCNPDCIDIGLAIHLPPGMNED